MNSPFVDTLIEKYVETLSLDAVKEKEVTKSYYDAHDVSIMLGIGLRKAYYIIA